VQRRGVFVIAGCFVSLAGYLILYNSTNAVASYIGSILAAMGVFSTIAVDLAWAGSMAGGDMRKGVVIAMVIGFGNLGGSVTHLARLLCLAYWTNPVSFRICSSFVYIDPPKFHIGHGTMMGWLGLS